MKKVDATVVRETVYIAGFVLILSVLMEAVFLLVGYWDYTVLLGNLLSGVAAVGNFFLMGLTVQKAVEKDEKNAATAMKLSQALRSLLLFALGALAPCFHLLATLIPLFFPRIAIVFRPLFQKNS